MSGSSSKPKGSAKKVGRNKRKPGSSSQRARTAKNKARRMLRVEKMAGRALSWPKALEDTMAALAAMRRSTTTKEK